MKTKTERIKFTTTLSKEHKDKLLVMSGFYTKRHLNDFLEELIDEKWECYKNEMGNKQTTR